MNLHRLANRSRFCCCCCRSALHQFLSFGLVHSPGKIEREKKMSIFANLIISERANAIQFSKFMKKQKHLWDERFCHNVVCVLRISRGVAFRI